MTTTTMLNGYQSTTFPYHHHHLLFSELANTATPTVEPTHVPPTRNNTPLPTYPHPLANGTRYCEQYPFPSTTTFLSFSFTTMPSTHHITLYPTTPSTPQHPQHHNTSSNVIGR